MTCDSCMIVRHRELIVQVDHELVVKSRQILNLYQPLKLVVMQIFWYNCITTTIASAAIS